MSKENLIVSVQLECEIFKARLFILWMGDNSYLSKGKIIHLQEFCIILVSVGGEPCDQPDPLSKASNCWVSVVTKPPGWKSKIFALLPI